MNSSRSPIPTDLLHFAMMASNATLPFDEQCLKNLESLINENLTLNAISKAFSALYAYDYLLTLRDEVEFAWKGRKTWLFSIYILNKYATMGLVLLYWIKPRVNLGTGETCPRAVIVDQVFLVCITLFSQMFMMLKVYAVSKKNKPLTGGLVLLMASQLIFGVFSSVRTATHHPVETIQLPDCQGFYRSCTLGGNFQMAYTGLSLAFDIPAFVAIICFSHPWRGHRIITTVHRTICQDSTAYFLSVLAIQIFVTIAISSGAPYPRALFPVITNVFIPLMVSRIVLSLRKAANSTVHRDDWTVGNLTTDGTGETSLICKHKMQFRQRTGFSTVGSDP